MKLVIYRFQKLPNFWSHPSLLLQHHKRKVILNKRRTCQIMHSALAFELLVIAHKNQMLEGWKTSNGNRCLEHLGSLLNHNKSRFKGGDQAAVFAQSGGRHSNQLGGLQNFIVRLKFPNPESLAAGHVDLEFFPKPLANDSDEPVVKLLVNLTPVTAWSLRQVAKFEILLPLSKYSRIAMLAEGDEGPPRPRGRGSP